MRASGTAQKPMQRPAVIATASAFTVASWSVIALVLWPIYLDRSFVVLAAVSITLAVALAIWTTIARWPAWGVMAAAVAIFTVIGVPLAVPSRTVYGVLPEPSGLLDLFAGVALGWRQLVTIDLPVGNYQALLVPALVMLFVGPLLTLSIALRTRAGELSALVPLIAFPWAIALGAERVALPISTAIVFAAVLLMWMAVWRRHRHADSTTTLPSTAWRDPRARGVRTVAAALALVLVAGGTGAAVVAALPPPADRTVLRTIVERPFEPLEQPSPLSAYRASFEPEVAEQVALTVEGAPLGARIRLAALDSYDGVVFAVGSDQVDSASGRFVRIPTVRDLSGSIGERAAVSVQLARETGVWLPMVGEFAAIEFLGAQAADERDRFVFNAVTGTAALVGGTSPGIEYRLEVVMPSTSARPLADAVPGEAAVPGIVAVPESLRDWLDAVAADAETPGERLSAALEGLARDGYLSHGVSDDEAPSRAGHSIDRLDELLTRRPMVGDAEQYAAAAALIAREIGFPSRVVLGYGPLEQSGTVALLENELTAWIEVSTAADGWVAIDVVPERRELPPAEPEDPVPVSRPQNAPQPPVDDPPALEELAPPEIEQADDPALSPFWQAVLAIITVAGWVLLVAGLIAAPLIAVAVAKALRRRRRRNAADPAVRILGGWSDVTDHARDLRIALPTAATRTEIAVALGRPAALVLARVTDRAVYAPEEPTSHEAERVWAASDAVRASLTDGLPRRERWRAAISPRSLRRYPEQRRATMGGRSR